MRSFFKVALLSLVLLVPAMTQAQDESLVKWTYVEAGYMDLDAGSVTGVNDLESDGYFIGGSFGFKMLHIIGQWDNTDGDNFEERRYDLGVGWHGLLGDRADIYADLHNTHRGLGFEANGTLRLNPHPRVQLQVVRCLELLCHLIPLRRC